LALSGTLENGASSMSDPIAEYQTATQKFEAAERKEEQVVKTITDAAAKLRDWRHVGVSDVNVGLPLTANSINGGIWPTPQQLAEALADYHKTLYEVCNAYDWIPPQQRQVIQPPPSR